MNDFKRTNESYDAMALLLSLLVNMLSSDDHNITYLLEAGIVEVLIKVCNWNDPSNAMSSDDIEYKILMCFNNLICSLSFDFGKDLLNSSN
jgi:hypothetical protein